MHILMSYDVITIIVGVTAAITGTHSIFAKFVVEPMLDKKLNQQSNDLKKSLVSAEAFTEYKAIDQREHDALSQSMRDLTHRIDTR